MHDAWCMNHESWIMRLFYSAGRAIVSRDGPSPHKHVAQGDAQNTQKPTPTKEAAEGRLHKGRRAPSAPAPLCGFLCGCWFLCILCCWAAYLCCLAISWHYCPTSRVEQAMAFLAWIFFLKNDLFLFSKNVKTLLYWWKMVCVCRLKLRMGQRMSLVRRDIY